MLNKIILIQGVGGYKDARNCDLAKVNIIYGENRNGKSTLCDVLRSLELNNPKLILDRKAIPNDATLPPEVKISFNANGAHHVAHFTDNTWQSIEPECSKLYVFDQSFIHRNVMTGEKQERLNSENVTSFILGEDSTTLYAKLAELNTSIRATRSSLTDIDKDFSTHNITNAQEYSDSRLPKQTKVELETQSVAQKTREQQITTTIKNIGAIKQRATLKDTATKLDFLQNIKKINSAITSSLQDVHQGALSSLESHVTNHVNNSSLFKGWAAQGVAFTKDDSCPFCGQGLLDDAKSLLASYQQVFNTEFDDFNRSTKQKLEQLRQPFVMPDQKENIGRLHQFNITAISAYHEPEISAHPNLSKLILMLNKRHDELLNSYGTLENDRQAAIISWVPILDQKFNIPYEKLQRIDFSVIVKSMHTYNKAIDKYWQECEKINSLLINYKNSAKAPQLHNDITAVTNNYKETIALIKRIDLEPLCTKYKKKALELSALEKDYIKNKTCLEKSQQQYLDKYFTSVTQLFTKLGSKDFTIIKATNNKGRQLIYELRIIFKEDNIPRDKVNFVFSESDRRALALCIFLAKILNLSIEDKKKAILVLDDPVTSFDNERITLILDKLYELTHHVKQLIINNAL